MPAQGFQVGQAFLSLGVKANDQAIKTVVDGMLTAMGKRFSEFYSAELDNIKNFGHTTATKVAVGAELAFAGFGTKLAGEVDTGLRQINTLFGQTGQAGKDNLEFITNAAEGLSRELGISQNEIIPGMYEAISAGIPKENIFSFMETAAKAGIAGATDTETAIDGLTTIINAFGLESSDAESVADSMFQTVNAGKTTFEELSASMFNVAPMAASVGVSYQEVNAALAAITAQGTPTAVATTQIRAAMQGLLRPSEEMDAIFQSLGHTNAQTALESEGLGYALKAVTDAAGGDQGKLQTLLGSVEAVGAANILTGEGAEFFNEQLVAQGDLSGTTETAFNEMDQSAGRSLQRLKTSWENLAIVMGQAVVPWLQRLGSVLEFALDLFNKLPAPVQQALGGLLLALTALGPPMLLFLKYWKLFKMMKNFTEMAKMATGAKQLGEAVVGAAKNTKEFKAFTILKTMGNWFLHPIKSVKALGSAAVESGKKLVLNLVNGAKRAATAIASMAVQAARATAQVVAQVARQVAAWVVLGAQSLLHAAKVAAAWLISMGPIALIVAAVAGAVALVITHWDTLSRWATTAFNAIKNTITAVWNGIYGFFSSVLGAISTAVMWYFNMYKTIITTVFNTIWNVITSVFNSIRGFIGSALNTISSIWSSVWGGMSGAVQWVWGGITGFISGKISWIVGLVSGMGGSISRAASGMWDGITNAFRSAINWIIRAWNGLEFSIPGFDPPGPGPSFGGFTLGVPNIPMMAKGGVIGGAGLAITGEAGAELQEMPSGARVTPLTGNNSLAKDIAREFSRLGSLGKSDININAQTNANPASIGRELAWVLKTSGR